MRLLALAACLVLAGSATPMVLEAREVASSASMPSAQAGALRIGRVILAGQPNADDFRRWHALGARHVLNVRTPDEMASLRDAGFDESALLESLGMRYVHVPIGGKAHPMRPQAVDALRDLLARDQAIVVVHCGSATRAGQIWAAHQVRDLEQTPTTVFRQLEPIGLWPLPLQLLTGMPVELEVRRER